MTAMAYLPMPAPGIGLELRQAPIGNTFLNWPVVEDETPSLRARARSCPGHVSLHPNPAPPMTPMPVAAAEPIVASKSFEVEATDLAANLGQTTKTLNLEQAIGEGQDGKMHATKPAAVADGQSGKAAPPEPANAEGKGGRAFVRPSFDKARPAALTLVKEEIVVGKLGNPADDTGCRTASTRCSDTWHSLEIDDCGEWEASDDLVELEAMHDDSIAELNPATDNELEGPESEEEYFQLTATKPARTTPSHVDLDSPKSNPAGGTTLMIQRLPVHISQSELAMALNRAGFQGAYDFLYMPTAFGTGQGSGYAFVNMKAPHLAQQLRAAWNRGRPLGRRQEKGLNVTMAHLQGREANIAKWNTPKMRRVRNPNHRPLIIASNSLSTAGTPKRGCVP